IEQHVLDTDMIVKPLKVPQSRRGARNVQMQRRRAMAGKIDMIGLAQGANLQERRDASTSRYVGLLYVHRLRFQHSAYIVDGVGIFAGGHLDYSRHALPNLRE